MEDDGADRQGSKIPANDNSPDGEAEGGEDISSLRKLDRVVLDIARLIGRQMAREDFARLQASAVNDNTARNAADGEDGTNED
ncbi:hypothetical protein [Pseudaminobacter salicylatoxidans]|uniref:hypothetical protein n=1 Tax=Pseudaminobacter salicylatoxidans TaxID=93369 RepID=UPI0002D6446D|nr:hypothetical protein [Pseudaminobacter salicylatoxidans]